MPETSTERDIIDFNPDQNQNETLRGKSIENDGRDMDNKSRVRAQNWTENVLTTWLLFVGTIIIFSGFKIVDIEKNVLITLLGTTTLNILGLKAIVLNGLFTKLR